MDRPLVSVLAEYASSLRYEDLPKEVIEKAKICLLDFLGMAAGGYEMEVSKLAIRTAKALNGPGNATVLMDGHKGRAIDCVLPNSVMAHSFMQDDWLQVSYTHTGVTVIPAVLAIAEETGNNGPDALLSIVVGYEIQARAGVLAVPTFKRGFRASGVYAPFASAAVAAKLMHLSTEQFKNALGCAGSMAGGVLQPWLDSSMEWAFEEAFGCREGILAALLAQQGLQGADHILEGPCGVNKCFAGTVEGQDETLKDLGRHFHIVDTLFKPFPSGGVNQESISMAVDLAQKHRIDYRKIRAVRIKIPPSGTTERMDYAGISYPGPFKSIDHCLISKPFAIAASLKNADFDIEIVRKEKDNPEMNELARKIHLQEMKEVSPLSMEIELEDGAVFRADGANILPDIYLNGERAREKFLKMASRTMGLDRVKQIMDLVFQMEDLDSVVPIVERMKLD